MGTELEFDSGEVRIGREPGLELTIEGEVSGVVSARHGRFFYRNDQWFFEDLGSKNGSYLDDYPVTPHVPQPVTEGRVIRFAQSGPRFRVDAARGSPEVRPTVSEEAIGVSPSAPTVPMDAIDTEPVPAVDPSSDEPMKVVLAARHGNERFELQGVTRIRMGRGKECEVCLAAVSDTSVSRVHAEIVYDPARGAVLRDAGSRNGTLVNGKLLTGEHVVKLGDAIKLGQRGPEYLVEELIATRRSGTPPEPPPVEASEPARRSFGGKGKTIFFKELVVETSRKQSRKLRWIVGGFFLVVVAVVAGLYWYNEQQVAETRQLLAEQRLALKAQEAALAEARAEADSVSRAARGEITRLRSELDEARVNAAPAVVVDSLRAALVEAEGRTRALEAALERARVSLKRQMAAGDSLRALAELEVRRLRTELSRANRGQVPRSLIDSLRNAMKTAEEKAKSIDNQLRAVRGVDLAAVAQANQRAVGLVSSYKGADIFDGTGFAITSSGYFITNRHVVMPEGMPADSVFVTMADEKRQQLAEIIKVNPPGMPDLALIRIIGYTGARVKKIDWTSSHARQGEPAALIGFPAGVAAAIDRRTRSVRTSMSAGIFSKITEDEIQFDGFTVGGSSGSPIFNAAGEVVAVHRAGLKAAAGLGFAVPIRKALALLTPDARSELGVSTTN